MRIRARIYFSSIETRKNIIGTFPVQIQSNSHILAEEYLLNEQQIGRTSATSIPSLFFYLVHQVHLCFLTNTVLKKSPSSPPAQAVVNFPTLFFCTFAGGQIKCIFRQESSQTKSTQKLGVVFFSGLKEAKKKMCLGCPTTG